MNHRKRKFMIQFGVCLVVILALLAIVLLQNSDNSEEGCEEGMEAQLSADGAYEAVPKQTVLLGEDYVQVTIAGKDGREVYEIPDLFRCKDYQGIYWGAENAELWIDTGSKGILCYQKTGTQWTKYQLEQTAANGGYKLKGDGNTEIEVESNRIPSQLVK